MKKLLVIAVVLISVFHVSAQEKRLFNAGLGVDVVNQHIWRGTHQANVSIQPYGVFSLANVELTVWGSSDFTTNHRKIEPSLFYNFYNFKIGVTDYWASDNFSKYCAGHLFETTIGWRGYNIPIHTTWNTVVWGDEKTYSSYFNIGYDLFCYDEWFIDFEVGISPWENVMIGNNDFEVVSTSITLHKEWDLSSSLAIKTLGNIVYNPSMDRMWWTFGIGFYFN
jgi:hypothetical protein